MARKKRSHYLEQIVPIEILFSYIYPRFFYYMHEKIPYGDINRNDKEVAFLFTVIIPLLLILRGSEFADTPPNGLD